MADEKWKLASLVIKAVASCFRKKVWVTKNLQTNKKKPTPTVGGKDAVLYGKRL